MRTAVEDADKLLASSPAAEHWAHIGIRHHHGIDIPLFSLKSEKSCGIGEYMDLIPLADWCVKVGFDVIQLLPLNDLGKETSPYNALSAYALNPDNISLTALDDWDKSEVRQSYVTELQKLNSEPRVAYDKVRPLKENFLFDYLNECSEEIVASAEYQEFYNSNRAWLVPYALFKILKQQHGIRNWENWPKDDREPCPGRLEEIRMTNQVQFGFHCLIQFICFKQMNHARQECEKRGVWIKGDVPILISRDSADVWSERRFFHLDYSAGAPPDAYSATGQNWGFPIFNWDALKADDYRWWRERLRMATGCYHLYRIDHLVGFFRIWAIPKKGKAQFIPEDESTWVDHGRTILEMMIQSSPMLPIAEDLGVIPDGVRACMEDLGLCGTRVVRWERDWGSDDQTFIDPKTFSPISMTTVSTHDSETLEQWWRDQTEEAKAYATRAGWIYDPVLTREQRIALLRESHKSSSLFHVNLIGEYLALDDRYVAQDPDDERINTPGVIATKNWSYRVRPSIEQLLQDDEFCADVRSAST